MIDWKKPCQTTDGRPVTSVVIFVTTDEQPVYGLLDDGVCNWSLNGSWHSNGLKDENDVINTPEPKATFEVFVYRDKYGRVYTTTEVTTSDYWKLIAKHTITEGNGL